MLQGGAALEGDSPMKMLENLKRRHARLEHELRAELAQRLPDETRVMRLKKLKLAVKDRMLMMARQRRQMELPIPA